MNTTRSGTDPAHGTPAARHPHPHESAHLHVSGEAMYVDDLPELARTAHAALGLSPQAHARIIRLDLNAVRAMPGVIGVLTAADIPGRNDCGPVVHDDPILAGGEVHYIEDTVVEAYVFLIAERHGRSFHGKGATAGRARSDQNP